MTNWLIELKSMTQEEIGNLPQEQREGYGYNLECLMDESQSAEESEAYFELMQKLTANTTKPARTETKEYQNWAASYNAAYHDYGLRGDAITAAIGKEPIRYVSHVDVTLVSGFPHAAKAAAVTNWIDTAAADFHLARKVWEEEDDYHNTLAAFEAGTGRI